MTTGLLTFRSERRSVRYMGKHLRHLFVPAGCSRTTPTSGSTTI